MKIIMLGAPGSGKGTRAAMLSEKFSIPHISTGDIFRANIKEGTELGRKAKDYMDKGELVPDSLVCDLVVDRIQQPDCKNGYILDGFPRTIPQAEALTKALDSIGENLDHVINVYAPDEDIIKRMSGRRSCPVCGAVYHVDFAPSSKGDICDKCGAGLIQRDDDKPETVKKRLDVYYAQTYPLIEYYEKMGLVRTVDSTGGVETALSDILKVIGE